MANVLDCARRNNADICRERDRDSIHINTMFWVNGLKQSVCVLWSAKSHAVADGLSERTRLWQVRGKLKIRHREAGY